MKAIMLCGRSAGEEFNDHRMAKLRMIRDIHALLALPRCQSCTESSNVSLAHACDAAGLRPSHATLERLRAAIAADQSENPHLWKS